MIPTEPPAPDDALPTPRRDDRLFLRPLWVLPGAAILLAVVLSALAGREARPDEMRATTALIGFAVIGVAAAVECLLLMGISAARHPRLRRWAVHLTTGVLGLGAGFFFLVVADAVIRDRHAAAGLFLRLDPIVDALAGLLLAVAWGGVLLVFVAGLAVADAVADGRARRRESDEGLGAEQ